jgi:hypothetical protein
MGINLDLTKVFHPRFVDVLTAFMPGLFFEACVLVGNPALVLSLSRPPIDRPLAIAVTVFMAFIIGNVFMLWVSLIQSMLKRLIRVWFWIYPPLWKHFLQFLLHARGNPPRQSWFGSFRFLQLAYSRAWNDDRFQDVARAWQRIAARLLRHYEIAPPDGLHSEAWQPWQNVLGLLEPEDVRGWILLMATHATGWSGLSAIHFAPALRSPYFLGFCLFSIFMGLLGDWSVAYRLNSPESSWALGVRRAFEELQRVLDKQPEAEEQDDGANRKPTG